jgi:hypothetical protein
MTTITMHMGVERARFAMHALTSVGSLLSGAARTLTHRVPAAAKASTRKQIVREANRLREMARRYANTDPGFASDLYGAATRHEELNDG